MGRPTDLTPATAAAIIAAISAGAYYRDAAAAGGVDYSTFRRWLVRAEEDDAPVEFREFREAVDRAEGEALLRALDAWTSAFSEDWRAARDFLARRYPDRWSDKQRLDVTHEGRAVIEVVVDEDGVHSDEAGDRAGTDRADAVPASLITDDDRAAFARSLREDGVPEAVAAAVLEVAGPGDLRPETLAGLVEWAGRDREEGE